MFKDNITFVSQESESSTTSTTGSFWPSQSQVQHRTRPSSSATYVAWGSGSTLLREYCHPANECHSWAQLSTQCRWQQLSQWSELRRVSAMRLPSRKGPPIHSKYSRKCSALWHQIRQYFIWVCFACNPSSSDWSRGFHLQLACHRYALKTRGVPEYACTRGGPSNGPGMISSG